MNSGARRRYGLEKMVEGIKNTRDIGKADMVHNDVMPDITVHPGLPRTPATATTMRHPGRPPLLHRT